jgi:molecular chaperone DnaJ
MSAQPDPHAELGVPSNASPAEVHQAFRRRLREHHPDTRPHQDESSGSASDQALQRVLAAYETLRHQKGTPSVQAAITGQPYRPDQQAPAVRSVSPEDPRLKATAVHWVPAAGPGPIRHPAHDRTRYGVPRPDWLIRWLLGQ